MTHFEHLKRLVPDITTREVLDLGAGKGGFLIELAQKGIFARGLEYSQSYIEQAQAAAQLAGVSVAIEQGRAESLPYADMSFDFVNVNEVIEHVENPEAMVHELHRVLRPGGIAYMSVPNRFGCKDQHFHLYLVNWLPRMWADSFIAFFGQHKEYADISAGHQRLADMHYYTYEAVQALVRSAGLDVSDIRPLRIKQEYHGLKKLAAEFVYPLARFAYFDSFHLLIRKS